MNLRLNCHPFSEEVITYWVSEKELLFSEAYSNSLYNISFAAVNFTDKAKKVKLESSGSPADSQTGPQTIEELVVFKFFFSHTIVFQIKFRYKFLVWE